MTEQRGQVGARSSHTMPHKQARSPSRWSRVSTAPDLAAWQWPAEALWAPIEAVAAARRRRSPPATTTRSNAGSCSRLKKDIHNAPTRQVGEARQVLLRRACSASSRASSRATTTCDSVAAVIGLAGLKSPVCDSSDEAVVVKQGLELGREELSLRQRRAERLALHESDARSP